MKSSVDMEGDFFEKLAHANRYPSDAALMRLDERPMTALSYAKHFTAQEDKFFDENTNDQTMLLIRDYGYDVTQLSGLPRDRDVDVEAEVGGVKFRQLRLRNIKQLRVRLGWPNTGPDKDGEDIEDDDPRERSLTKDPKCRFILVETSSSESRLLRLTKEMLLLILTYHQVPPCYLNFITCIGSSTGASDLNYGGFRSRKSLCETTRGPVVKSLGRSGWHYQVSFRLQTMQKQEHSEEVHQWRQHSVAIHHRFDAGSGTSLWVLTGPREPILRGKSRNYMWESLKRFLLREGHSGKFGSGLCEERFGASLAVLVGLAEWSIEDCSLYLEHLEEKLMDVIRTYLYPIDGAETMPDTVAKDLRSMTILIDNIQDWEGHLKDNKCILQSLKDFYQADLLKDLAASDAKLDWVGNATDQVQKTSEQLQRIINETAQLLVRASRLSTMARDKGALVERLLQNQNGRRMQEITELTSHDSGAMRKFALVTLVLLPCTVVSTVLSTDIVKFQYLNEAPQSSPPPSSSRTYNFSIAAFITWLILALILTLISLWSAEAWKRPARHGSRPNLRDLDASVLLEGLWSSSEQGAEDSGDGRSSGRGAGTPPSPKSLGKDSGFWTGSGRSGSSRKRSSLGRIIDDFKGGKKDEGEAVVDVERGGM